MVSDKTIPTTLHHQLLILSKQAGGVRNRIKDSQAKVPFETSEELENLEITLEKISKKMKISTQFIH